MKTCAYCEKEAFLTKEHIWPDCLIEKYEDLRTYNNRENKYYKGDPTIKDVCADCNNVLLSNLDFYLCNLYDNFFRRILKPGEGTHIEYDYDLLLRSLLKISYNSSRATANAKIVNAHKRIARYILNGEFRPDIALRLLIVTASKVINVDIGSESSFEPNHLRCAEIPYEGPLSHRFSVRLVAINCFWFYIIIPYKNEPSYKWSEFTAGFENWKLQPGIPISVASNSQAIAVHQTTYLHPQMLGNLLTAITV